MNEWPLPTSINRLLCAQYFCLQLGFSFIDCKKYLHAPVPNNKSTDDDKLFDVFNNQILLHFIFQNPAYPHKHYGFVVFIVFMKLITCSIQTVYNVFQTIDAIKNSLGVTLWTRITLIEVFFFSKYNLLRIFPSFDLMEYHQNVNALCSVSH